MKRAAVGLCIAVLALIAAVPVAAPTAAEVPASIYEAPDAVYTYVTHGAGSEADPYWSEVRALSGTQSSVVLQSALEGYPVTTLTLLTGCTAAVLVVPATVTSIAAGAFADCSGLTDLYFLGDRPAGTLPAEVTVHALAGTSGWPTGTAVLPKSVYQTASAAFSYCVLGGGATVLGLVSGTALVIPDADADGVPFTAVAADAFTGAALVSAELGPRVREIGDRAFYKCFELTSATLPASLEVIRDEAFRYCLRLGNVDLQNVGFLGFECFRDCESFTAIIIPDSVTVLGGGAFYICNAARTVTVGKGVAGISERAFGYCYALESISFAVPPANVERSAFINCRSLTSLDLSGTRTLGDSALYGCSVLTAVSLGSQLTSVGPSAFGECRSLTELRFPATLASVGAEAFFHCRSLTEVYFAGEMPAMTAEPFYGAGEVTVHVTAAHQASWQGYTGTLVVDADAGTPDPVWQWAAVITVLAAALAVGVWLLFRRRRGSARILL